IVAEPVDSHAGSFEIRGFANFRVGNHGDIFSVGHAADKTHLRSVSRGTNRACGSQDRHSDVAGNERLRYLWSADVDKRSTNTVLLQQPWLCHKREERVGSTQGGVPIRKIDLSKGRRTGQRKKGQSQDRRTG